MKPFFKILLASILLLLFTAAVLVGYLLNNKRILTNFVIEQINQNLNAELKVKSSDVTIFQHFPNVSLDLVGVSLQTKTDNILTANHLYFGFNIKDILNKNYHIQIITLDSATINLKIDENGKSSLDIVKGSNETESKNTNFLIDLEKVKLKRINFNFNDLLSNQQYQAQINEAEFDGSFKNTEFELNAYADAFVNKISSSNVNFVKDKSVVLKANIAVNNTKKTYAFKNTELKVNELNLLLNGLITGKQVGSEIQMDFDSKKISIASLFSLLPIKIPTEVLAYESKGNVFFKGSINGLMSPITNPKVLVNFGVSNGSIHNQKLNIELNNISMIGKFDNGSKQNLATSTLVMNNIKAKLANDQINGDVTLENLLAPKLNLALAGTMNLENLFQLFPVKAIESINGSVNFETKIKADLADKNTNNIWKQAGNFGKFNLLVNNLKIKDFDKKVDHLEANFALNGADLAIEKCNVNLNQSDVKISGSLNNFLGYLFGNNENLAANINYNSSYVDMEHVIFMPETKKENNAESKYNLPQNIDLQIHANIDKFKYNQFIASNLSCKIQVLPMQIIINQAKLNALNGSINFAAKVLNSKQGNYFVESKIDLKNINITEAFKQCNNFGQNNITAQNLKGTYNGVIDFAGVWDEKLNCKTDKIYAKIKVQLLNGELINYKPLTALSKFVSLNDLRNLKFAELNNTIEISQQTISIPKMLIENNAVNITLSGSQNFDNFIDYDLIVNLSEILRKKLKAKDNEFGEEDEKKKGINLFINMRGPIDNLKFVYNKTAVKQNIKEKAKAEGKSIIDVLKKEVGITPNNNKPLDKPKEKQNDNDELEFEKD
ncbi:MAG: AsmA-like C-terminal region-containing protein [Candidatus Methylacidiphilales bacterium]